MILDEDMTQNLQKEFKELNEKNLEGRVERIWISEKNEEMQNFTLEENEELFLFKMGEEKILELFQQNLDGLFKNELNHEEPPWRTLVTKGWRDKIEGWKNKMSLAMI